MKHYYIAVPTMERCLVEVTETEFAELIGDENTRLYAFKVYRGTMTIDDVPEELREEVQTVVNNKIARWGTYENRDLPDSDTDEATEADYQAALREMGVEV